MMVSKAAKTEYATKTEYSEKEAAEELGISVEQLRTLIRSHIVETEEDLSKVAVASFHPSDLLLLRILSKVPQSPSEGQDA
ncbi:MAG TPA: hypothetical protein VKV15_01930 [Bryobacteraceae bacterium]|nr:hypothetical protein [Bryobacteraceae bacterium]